MAAKRGPAGDDLDRMAREAAMFQKRLKEEDEEVQKAEQDAHEYLKRGLSLLFKITIFLLRREIERAQWSKKKAEMPLLDEETRQCLAGIRDRAPIRRPVQVQQMVAAPEQEQHAISTPLPDSGNGTPSADADAEVMEEVAGVAAAVQGGDGPITGVRINTGSPQRGRRWFHDLFTWGKK